MCSDNVEMTKQYSDVSSFMKPIFATTKSFLTSFFFSPHNFFILFAMLSWVLAHYYLTAIDK